MNQLPVFMTVAQFAEASGFSQSTVAEMVDKKLISHILTGTTKVARKLIPASELANLERVVAGGLASSILVNQDGDQRTLLRGGSR